MKRVAFALAALLLLLTFSACSDTKREELSGVTVKDGLVTETETSLAKQITAVISTTKGTVTVALDPEKAPLAVENFVRLAKSGYYDGLLFHRVVSDMMIQSGDKTGTGIGGDSIWDLPFGVEWDEEMNFYSGALAMANSKGKNTSQFFIVDTQTVYTKEYFDAVVQSKKATVTDAVRKKYTGKAGLWWLEGSYTVFGRVTDGMEVVHQIASVKTENERPVADVQILSVKISERSGS